MKIIVAGPRDYNNTNHIFNTIIKFIKQLNLDKRNITIISGGAKGVDSIAIDFAKYYSLPYQIFPADWNTYGKSAGPIRNTEMAKNAQVLIAFYNGSKGTTNMINTAKKNGLKIFIDQI